MSDPIAMDEEALDLSKLPKADGLSKSTPMYQYQGTWYWTLLVPNIIAFQTKFQAQEGDIVLASNPKSGTTWLKALLFSIRNRSRYTSSDTPVLTSNPHQLVPFFELNLFSQNPTHDLPSMTAPRLFATHLRYSTLPGSVVKGPECRIVYVCRNPLDFITSFWHYAAKTYPEDDVARLTLEATVDKFCTGEHEVGPFWDHVLGFWKASLKNPERVLFLKYEDLLEDTVSHAKRIAEFVGLPFSDEEKSNGVVEQLVELCSFSSLKELNVNKHGNPGIAHLENKIFFRKGKVGDWVNHLSPSMVERVENVIREKLSGSGLTFKFSA